MCANAFLLFFFSLFQQYSVFINIIFAACKRANCSVVSGTRQMPVHSHSLASTSARTYNWTETHTKMFCSVCECDYRMFRFTRSIEVWARDSEYISNNDEILIMIINNNNIRQAAGRNHTHSVNKCVFFLSNFMSTNRKFRIEKNIM